MRRVGALAAVAAVAGLALWVMLRGASYEVSLDLSNASQLVKGDLVKVGGVPVGKVSSISLADDGRARLQLSVRDDSLTPLPVGTKAVVRSTSLAGIANRYVALQLGPNNAGSIPDGGRIPAEDGEPEVDLDAVLNTLGPSAQRDLSDLVRAGSGLIGKKNERYANAGLHALNPALSQSAATAREIVRDENAFTRFLIESADVVNTVTSRPADLHELVGNTSGALGALADRSNELDRTLVELPGTLRSANTTLVNLRATIADLRPMMRDAQPAAPLLSALLERLSPFSRQAVPLVARLRRTVDAPGRSDDLLGVVRGFPEVATIADPAFKSVHDLAVDGLPVVQNIRPYTPEVIGGLAHGFGGSTSGYYDANGHYARISFQGSPYTFNNQGTLVPAPPSQNGLTGYRDHIYSRCPGGATQPLPDKSNPFLPSAAFPCKAEDTIR